MCVIGSAAWDVCLHITLIMQMERCAFNIQLPPWIHQSSVCLSACAVTPSRLHVYKHVNICLYVHAYTYICIRTYIPTYAYVYEHTYVHTHTYMTCICTYAYVYEHAYVHMHTYMNIHMYVCIRIWTYVHLHTCMNMHTYAYVYERTYVLMHTYMNIHAYVHTYIHMLQYMTAVRTYDATEQYVRMSIRKQPLPLNELVPTLESWSTVTWCLMAVKEPSAYLIWHWHSIGASCLLSPPRCKHQNRQVLAPKPTRTRRSRLGA